MVTRRSCTAWLHACLSSRPRQAHSLHPRVADVAVRRADDDEGVSAVSCSQGVWCPPSRGTAVQFGVGRLSTFSGMRNKAGKTGNRDDFEGAATRAIPHASSVSSQEREPLDERADRILVQDEIGGSAIWAARRAWPQAGALRGAREPPPAGAAAGARSGRPSPRHPR